MKYFNYYSSLDESRSSASSMWKTIGSKPVGMQSPTLEFCQVLVYFDFLSFRLATILCNGLTNYLFSPDGTVRIGRVGTFRSFLFINRYAVSSTSNSLTSLGNSFLCKTTFSKVSAFLCWVKPACTYVKADIKGSTSIESNAMAR